MPIALIVLKVRFPHHISFEKRVRYLKNLKTRELHFLSPCHLFGGILILVNLSWLINQVGLILAQ